TRFVRELRAADAHGRFYACYPHVDGLKEGTCIDLHSKLMIVDDEWLRVGSSNLSNRSMGMDSECDLTFEARGDARIGAAIRGFRDALVAEHAGTEPRQVTEAIAAHGSMSAAIAALPKNARRIETLEAPEIAHAQLNLVAVADLEKPLPLEAIVREFAPDTSAPLLPGRRLLALLCLVFVILALAWTYTPLARLVTRENVLEWGREFAGLAWAPLIVILAYTPASYAMFPRWFITMIAVIAFGPWRGFLYGLCGRVIAAVVSYLPGRLVRRDTVRRLAGPRLNRMSAALYHRGALAVAIVRLLPIAPFVVVNLVMGAMRIRLRDFVLGSLVGIIPGMLAATVLSEQISHLLVAPSEINGWLIAIAVALLVTIVYVGQRWLRRLDRETIGR
ncbi:MAG TPA: VTT domain-containing protein, partial [Usitatibacter sp.]|nr:VTT domain-containing protein [Usitatibacter sp.]